MYKKTCDRCFRSSFSATNIGKWLCPVCQRDLSDLKARDSESYTFKAFTVTDNKAHEISSTKIEKYI